VQGPKCEKYTSKRQQEAADASSGSICQD